MSIETLDKSLIDKLKAHGYLRDESNMRLYCARQKKIRAMSACDSFSHFGKRIVIHPSEDKVFLQEDDGCTDFHHPSDTLDAQLVIFGCETFIGLIEDHSFLDGEEDLIPKVIRFQLLESLSGRQVSRTIKVFPVVHEKTPRPTMTTTIQSPISKQTMSADQL